MNDLGINTGLLAAQLVNLLLLLLCAGLAVGVPLALLLRVWRHNRQNPRRELVYNRAGEVVAVGETRRGATIALRGTGSQASKPYDLLERVYRVEYRFPDDVLTSVRLIHARTGDDETMFVKSGSGSVAVRVAENGQYIIEVEPAAARAAWTLEMRPLSSGQSGSG